MIHVGSCSWTEKSLIKSREFYPEGVSTSEKRLRYYASRFDEELKEFIPSVHEAAKKAEETYVMFNNCHLGYSMKNALRLRELMKTEERVKNTA
jgi:uncharacterized protein YecE (DUF72 family)